MEVAARTGSDGDWTGAPPRSMAGSGAASTARCREAIFLTQGFVYDSAEQAEARFAKAGDDEFIYARYGNPTVRMFEERIAALEGTEDAFATASGMAAVNGALASMLKAGDHVVSSRALFGSCLYILEEVLTRFGVEVTFVDGTDLDGMARGDAAGHPGRLLRERVEPDAGGHRHRRRGADRPCGGRDGRRRQRLCHAGLQPRRRSRARTS